MISIRRFAVKTASPVLGSLNSGMQIYRLKEENPEVFSQVNGKRTGPEIAKIINKKSTNVTLKLVNLCDMGLLEENGKKCRGCKSSERAFRC